MTKALRDRNILIYVIQSLLSGLGSGMMWLALAVWASSLRAGGSDAASIIFAYTIGALFGPLSGLLVDRFGARRSAILANGVGVVVVTPLFFLSGAGSLWVAQLCMVAYGIIGSATSAAGFALIPEITTSEDLPHVNSLIQAISSMTRLITPIAGAGLVSAFGISSVVLIDSMSFVLALALLALVKTPRASLRDPGDGGGSLLRELISGVAYLARTKEISRPLVSCLITIFAFGLGEPLIFAIVSDGLTQKSSFVGFMLTIQAVATLCASPFAGRLIVSYGELRVARIALALIACSCAFLMARSELLVAAGYLTVGVGLPWFVTAINTWLQRETPPHLRGRIAGGFSFATSFPQVISVGASAWLITLYPYQFILAGMIALLVLSVLMTFGASGRRDLASRT
ncbi:MFS transporter [Nonomuraea sp. NPDC050556]|uniref:MFS transporter n=1 Tax=Nonomuraea sp. NPDC050556 TaxID=3364369 RepID=UPI0037B7BAF3